MPDGYRTGRFGSAGRTLFALVLVAAAALVAISLYVGSARSDTPPRGSGGPLLQATPGSAPPPAAMAQPPQ